MSALRAAAAARAIGALALIGVAWAVWAGTVWADESVDMDLFRAANLLYQDGNFEEAALTYERLVRLGYQDATLYYNLANAYYRNEDTGRAMVNYLRARRIAPFDEDIAANLALTREKVGTADYGRQPTPLLAQFAEWLPWLSLDAAAIVALLCWLTAWSAALAWIALRPLSRRLAVALRRVAAVSVIGLLLFGLLAIGGQMSRDHWTSIAVVTAQSADMHAAPSPRSTVSLSLDAGREVIALQTRAGWTQVQVPRTELVGWAPASAIETVIER